MAKSGPFFSFSIVVSHFPIAAVDCVPLSAIILTCKVKIEITKFFDFFFVGDMGILGANCTNALGV